MVQGRIEVRDRSEIKFKDVLHVKSINLSLIMIRINDINIR